MSLAPLTDTTSDSTLEAVLRRDRYIVLGALALLTLLAWTYVLSLAHRMAPAQMSGIDMTMSMSMNMSAMTPQARAWSGLDLAFGFVMWTVMMTAMMLPSVAPVILLYAMVGRQAQARHQPFAATGWFVGGYLLAWTGFSLLAVLLQAGLVHAALLTPQMASADNLMGGAILIAAGLYQWSPLKYKCLANCHAPLSFIQRHGGFRRDAVASVKLGLRHGLYCIGCCWALMLLLFTGGVMNVAWIAGLAVLVLLEKAMSEGRNVSRLVGAGLIIGGLVLAF